MSELDQSIIDAIADEALEVLCDGLSVAGSCANAGLGPGDCVLFLMRAGRLRFALFGLVDCVGYGLWGSQDDKRNAVWYMNRASAWLGLAWFTLLVGAFVLAAIHPMLAHAADVLELVASVVMIVSFPVALMFRVTRLRQMADAASSLDAGDRVTQAYARQKEISQHVVSLLCNMLWLGIYFPIVFFPMAPLFTMVLMPLGSVLPLFVRVAGSLYRYRAIQQALRQLEEPRDDDLLVGIGNAAEVTASLKEQAAKEMRGVAHKMGVGLLFSGLFFLVPASPAVPVLVVVGLVYLALTLLWRGAQYVRAKRPIRNI